MKLPRATYPSSSPLPPRPFAPGPVLIPLAALGLGLAFVGALQSSLLLALILPVLLLVGFLLTRLSLRHIPGVMVAIFAVTAFPLSLGGEASAVNFSAADTLSLLLALALPALLIRRGRLSLGPVGLPLLIFFGIAAISSLIHWEGFETAVSLIRMGVATALTVLIFANGDDRVSTMHRCFTYLLIGMNVLTAFSVFAFLHGGIQGSMYTLGINKNELGPIYGCGIVVALGYLLTDAPPTDNASLKRRLWLIATLGGAAAGSLLSLSRGGWIATCVGCLLVFLMTKNVRAFLLSLVVMAVLVTALWRLLPAEATDYASDISTKAHTVQTRFSAIDQVMQAYESSPLIGVGIGLRKQIEPHDVLVLTLGETGIVGVLAFVGMFASAFYTFYLAGRRVANDPQAWPIVVIGTAILLVSLTHGMMDVYWRRGVGATGWACVGMAVSLLTRPLPGPQGAAPENAPRMALSR